MECLSPEQVASYLRGRGNGESRLLEAHVRDCPRCAMELLLARETLHELKTKASRPATERLRAARRRSSSWIPWTAAAAAALLAILAYAFRPVPAPKSDGPIARPNPVPVVPKNPVVVAPEKKIEEPKRPEIAPEAPKPRPELKPELPVPKLDPKPVPEPVKPPDPPKPEPTPEPKKSNPTIVERSVVARVTHAVGPSVVGKQILAGDTLATGRQEFVAVQLDGYGSLYFRENSRAEIGINGEINLIDGEMLAKIDGGRRLGALKTPAAEVEVHASLFAVQASKASTEVSVIEGNAAVGALVSKGPSALFARAGKSAELRPLDPGFASWVPEKLAVKKFAGWFEGESLTFQGFKAVEMEGASGRRAAVQSADQGTAALKSALPFKAPHAVWVRVRTYEAKATDIGLHMNGQSLGSIKIEPDPKAWRWVRVVLVTSDRLDLVLSALSRLGTGERNSFPVVIDGVWVTSDPKAQPPEKIGDERRSYELLLEEPAK